MPQNVLDVCEVPKYHNGLNQKVQTFLFHCDQKVNEFVFLKDKYRKYVWNQIWFQHYFLLMKVKVQMTGALNVDAITYWYGDWYGKCGWRDKGFVLV